MSNLDALHSTHDLLTGFRERASDRGTPCGCIVRGDSVALRYCSQHNTRVGTHGQRGKGSDS